jgi:protein SCO1/2
VYGKIPAFSLTERNGSQVSRENLLGTVWIADFIFTRCLATCPQQTATMAQLQGQLASERDIRLVSITVDPDYDTPEVLRRYAERYHADPQRWLFLTGEERAIYALAQEGFHLAAANQAAAPTPVARAFSGVSSDPVPRPENGPAAAAAPADPQAGLVHDVRFALVDRRARIRGYYSGLDPEAIARLRQDVRTLLAYKE